MHTRGGVTYVRGQIPLHLAGVGSLYRVRTREGLLCPFQILQYIYSGGGAVLDLSLACDDDIGRTSHK